MNFTQQMEELFGTDAACGVIFVEELDEGTPRRWTADEYDALPDPKPDVYSELPNGWSACTCTGYAHLVRERLGDDRVQVVGFANKDNPTSLIAIEEWHPGGHDFAIVDGRYIVDPWPRLVHFGEPECQIVYDLLDPTTTEIYGPRECWSELAIPDPAPAPAPPAPEEPRCEISAALDTIHGAWKTLVDLGRADDAAALLEAIETITKTKIEEPACVA
jgi:hypothetical protein